MEFFIDPIEPARMYSKLNDFGFAFFINKNMSKKVYVSLLDINE